VRAMLASCALSKGVKKALHIWLTNLVLNLKRKLVIKKMKAAYDRNVIFPDPDTGIFLYDFRIKA
jgi:hypothetical protein